MSFLIKLIKLFRILETKKTYIFLEETLKNLNK
jgi:hypothetical protein